jgi:carbamate kinase
VNARLICEQIANLVKHGYHVVITHGNGPQVGAQLLRSESGAAQTYPIPLEVCVAMTQGEIGYILETTLQSVLYSINKVSL